MNFDYSYRAFLISCLLVGNLVLLLVSVRLSGSPEPVEEFTAVEYTEELLEEELAINVTDNVRIETNRAYNEAEKFISELEESREEMMLPEDLSEENQESKQSNSTNDYALDEAQDRLQKIKEKLADNSNKTEKSGKVSATSRKTTISYYLEGRTALNLRNPVYTCDSGGKVVINIEVNSLGKVIHAHFNKGLSTTTNGCLIESALTYAERAKFTTLAARSKQTGTITYSFPGQY
ncbi:MAG: hypothetical protein HKO54_11250 [Flavobacteriaceae bacterium]|nr:hypothetical protein [Flavobacteriaceae bacterium]